VGFELKGTTVHIFAQRRRHDDGKDLHLRLILSQSEVYDIQTVAQLALGFERKCYSVAAPVVKHN